MINLCGFVILAMIKIDTKNNLQKNKKQIIYLKSQTKTAAITNIYKTDKFDLKTLRVNS